MRLGQLSKKQKIFLGGAIALIGTGFLLGRVSAPGRGGMSHSASKQQAQYQCPMHPTYISERPGDCPICGMSLVEVKQTEPAGGSHSGHGQQVEGYAPVKLGSQRRQLIGVKTEGVKIRKLVRTIHTVGWIAYDPDLYHAQEEYLAALEGHRRMGESTIPEIRERAKKLVESSRLRLRLLGLSEAQVEAVKGQTGPDTRLLLTEAQETAWLYGSIYEYELHLVKEGDPVEVELRAFPGELFSGKVQSIDTVLDPKTRSARVRVIIPNSGGKLKPQMFANARIDVSLGEHLAVPEAAVIDTGRRKLVFVDHGEGHFVPVSVVLAHKAEGYFAVLGGLEEGQRVVTSGNFLIDSESKLKASTSAAAAGGHQH